MGWLVGSSTRTPVSSISIIALRARVTTALWSGNLRGRGGSGRRGRVRRQRVWVGAERRQVIDLQDVRQVAIALAEVQPVSDDEAVRTLEAGVRRMDRHDPAGGLVQERAQ